MRKLFIGLLIGLGIVVGFSIANEMSVNACEKECVMDKCALCEEMYCMEEECEVTCSCGIEVFELEVDYIAEHKEKDACEDPHILCENCGAFFCLTEDCWCGKYEVSESGAIEYEEIFTSVASVSVVSVEELMIFEEMIYDIYCEEYCTNYCEECDSYYYTECMCEACASDCYGCLYYDFELFVANEMSIIMDIYEEVMKEVRESIIAREKESSVIKNVVSEF